MVVIFVVFLSAVTSDFLIQMFILKSIALSIYFKNTLVYQRLYSGHNSYFHVNSLYLKLLISQSKLSGIRKIIYISVA